MMQDKEKLSNNRVTVWNNNEGLKKKKKTLIKDEVKQSTFHEIQTS